MELAKSVIFFDFDNTITKFDVIDDMLERFSKDDAWRDLEKKWKSGEIGSRKCLDGQMRGIRVKKRELDAYLSTVKLDPHFKKILKLRNTRNTKKVILSDNFRYIIRKVLENNGIGGLDIYCNSMRIRGGRFEPEFPYAGAKCKRCAHCKTGNLLANLDKGFEAVYIGDGLSDLCPSRKADLVFAKDTLRRRLGEEKIPFVPFDDLGDVYKYFKNNSPES